MVSDRLKKIERSHLELGSELFRLRCEVADLRERSDQCFSFMRGLRNLLEANGVMSAEEFDDALAIELSSQEPMSGRPELEHSITSNSLKKLAH